MAERNPTVTASRLRCCSRVHWHTSVQRTSAETPEHFGLDIARHFLKTYPILTAVDISVEEMLWERATVEGKEHDHAFLKQSPGKVK